MARRRSRLPAAPDFPPPLRLLVRACHIECPAGHAEALSTFITLGLHMVPVRGIFEPGTREEPELYSAIDSVAQAHLGLAAARQKWRTALKAANLPLETQDAIETAALQVQFSYDTAYFYAGLGFGLTFSYLHRAT